MKAPTNKLPKAKSEGEEGLARDLACYKILAVREYRFDEVRQFRADFFIQPNILVEVEGGTWKNGRHNRGKGMEDDAVKYNTAVLRGYRLLRFTTNHVLNGYAIDTVREALG